MVLLGVLGYVAIFIEAAPLGPGAQALPSPDLLFCAVAAMALRRPSSVPILLVFALGLSRDLLTDLPVGAGALALVLAAEWIKTRSTRLGDRRVFAEWAIVSGAFLAVLILLWVMVFISFVQPPYLMDLLRQWALTGMAYPLVAGIIRWVFGIGRSRGAKINTRPQASGAR